jgi:protein-L-isoaspartate(D-aspartate) O-methyltransferase
MSTSTTDAVTVAARAIPAELYHGADGKAVRPCTPAHVTLRHLRMLKVQPGMRVLEIGTGSGYSAAVLSHLVGPTGSVVTVDISADLSQRAARLYAEHGHTVRAVHGDGLLGWPDAAPYDRIFAGTTPPTIPAAWIDQLAPGGTLITGCLLSRLPGSYAVAHITKTADGALDAVVHAGGYTPTVGDEKPVARTYVTADDEPRFDLATDAETRPETARAQLEVLRGGKAKPWSTEPDEYLHLKNWLLALDPEGLLVATTEHGPGIGLGSGDVEPDAAYVTGTDLISRASGSDAGTRLNELVTKWRLIGSPSTHELPSHLVRTDSGYGATVQTLD